MNVDDRFERFRRLQDYVGWTEDDARRVAAAGPLLEAVLPGVVDDFYETILRHEPTRKVLTGGQAQIEMLKRALRGWLGELFSGRYDREYVERRWQVGRRHVELGLDQVYAGAALSRVRLSLLQALQSSWTGAAPELLATCRALNRLLDLDMTVIGDAYQDEHARRQQRVERLATIGQVAGGVAHELRNPLNVVKTSVYYLLHAQSATPEKVAEHLERIDRHVEVADGVITALSSFARMPAPNPGPLRLEACLREALELNPPPAVVEVWLDVQDGLPLVAADPRQLQIVIGNLVRNAYDAMPRGGRLGVVARGAAGRAAVEVRVTDTGVGIAPAELGQIMEPLFTTKVKGLGLGLAIARAILDKNGGELRVESEPGCGSVFTVRLAAAAVEVEDQEVGAAEPP